MVARGEIRPGAQVSVSVGSAGENLSISAVGGVQVERKVPTILIIDDNHDLLFFLAEELKDEKWEVLIAEDGPQARLAFYQRKPDVVLVDYMLGDDDGLQLGLEFQQQAPLTNIILMTGGGFSNELQAVCEERNLPVLYKPFLAQDVLNLVRGRMGKISAATTAR
jgi:two-component system response regulator HydG